MDISSNFDIKSSDLFTHSAQWNQLKTLCTTDENILNVEPEFLTSLEELVLSELFGLPSITRCWSGLKMIELDHQKAILSIADGVERGMFPDLTIVKLQHYLYSDIKLSLFKLFKAKIIVV